MIWIIVFDIIQALSYKYSGLIIVEVYENLRSVILSVLVFLVFYDVKAKKKKKCFLKTIRMITDTSLSCFLLLFMFDQIFLVDIFNKKHLKRFINSLLYLPFTIHVNFAASIISALITHNVSLLLSKSIYYFYEEIKECFKNEKDMKSEDNTLLNGYFILCIIMQEFL